MQVVKHIVSINTSGKDSVCVIGNVEKTDRGLKIRNKCKYHINSKAIPYALKALGYKSTVEIDCKEIITIKPHQNNSNGFINDSFTISGLVVDQVDGVKGTITLKSDLSKDIKFIAICPQKIQSIALKYLGEKCKIYLSAKTPKQIDRFRTVLFIDMFPTIGGGQNGCEHQYNVGVGNTV